MRENGASTGSVDEAIRQKLIQALSPQVLDVKNESHLHAGHAGSPGSGSSHYRLLVVSDAFAGKSLVNRQRMVNAALKEELAGPVHALAMKTQTPEEAAKDAP